VAVSTATATASEFPNRGAVTRRMPGWACAPARRGAV